MNANLIEQISSQLSGQNLDALSSQLGVDQQTANQAIQMALPMLIGALATNAADPQGAQSLDNALQKDHDGAILNNLSGFLGSQDNGAGPGILSHVFRAALPMIIASLSKSTGMQENKAGALLENLAPIVMGALGQQKRQQGLDAGAIASILLGATQQSRSANPTANTALEMLGSILSGATGNNQPGNNNPGGGLGGALGGILGKILR